MERENLDWEEEKVRKTGKSKCQPKRRKVRLGEVFGEEKVEKKKSDWEEEKVRRIVGKVRLTGRGKSQTGRRKNQTAYHFDRQV